MAITSPSACVAVETDGDVCRIILNRPETLNALDLEVMDALAHVTRAVAEDDAVRCVILKGAGDHFMAGGDVKHFGRRLEAVPDRTAFRHEIEAMIDGFHRSIVQMRAMPKPIVASVRGAAAGAGVSMMLACDLALAADTAFFTLAYCHLGASPDGGSTFALPRATGMKRAMEIALLGDRFDALTAERYGLVNRVVPEAELDAETEKLAARLAAGPTQAYARTKALLNASGGNDLAAQLAAEAVSFAEGALTDDFTEGVTAFNAKRKPAFTGK